MKAKTYLLLACLMITWLCSTESTSAGITSILKNSGREVPLSSYRYIGNDSQGRRILSRMKKRDFVKNRYGEWRHPDGKAVITQINAPHSGARRLYGYAERSVASEIASFYGGGYRSSGLHEAAEALIKSHFDGGTDILLDIHKIGGTAAPLAQHLGVDLGLNAGGPIGRFISLGGKLYDYINLMGLSPRRNFVHELGHVMDLTHPSLQFGRFGGFLPSELAASIFDSARLGMNLEAASLAALTKLRGTYASHVTGLKTFSDLTTAFRAQTGVEIPDFLSFMLSNR